MLVLWSFLTIFFLFSLGAIQSRFIILFCHDVPMTDASNPAFIPLFRTLGTAEVGYSKNPTIIYGRHAVLNKT